MTTRTITKNIAILAAAAVLASGAAVAGELAFTKKYDWLNENAPKYGFDDTVSNEHWHWEWVGK